MSRAPARDRSAEQGLVLVSVLLLLSLLGLATGASLWLTRAELWAAGRARAHLQALYTAEAGVQHALAVLAPAPDFAAVQAFAAHALSDASAPGPWPIGGGGSVFFPGPPFVYSLEIVSGSVSHDDSARLTVRSSATAVRGASRAVMATLARARAPYTPAAVVVTSGELDLAPGASGTVIDARLPEGGEQAAIGAASDAAAATAVAAAAGSGAVLRGIARGIVRRFDVRELARATGLPEADPETLATGIGSPEAPAVSVVRAGVTPALRGDGVVVTNGDLEVEGEVDFSGVVLVAGKLALGGGACALRGMVWAHALEMRAPCAISFDAHAIARADSALRLPRVAVLVALSDG